LKLTNVAEREGKETEHLCPDLIRTALQATEAVLETRNEMKNLILRRRQLLRDQSISINSLNLTNSTVLNVLQS
jgi:hypothetical protein